MTLIVDYLFGKYLLNGFRVLVSDVPTYFMIYESTFISDVDNYVI